MYKDTPMAHVGWAGDSRTGLQDVTAYVPACRATDFPRHLARWLGLTQATRAVRSRSMKGKWRIPWMLHAHSWNSPEQEWVVASYLEGNGIRLGCLVVTCVTVGHSGHSYRTTPLQYTHTFTYANCYGLEQPQWSTGEGRLPVVRVWWELPSLVVIRFLATSFNPLIFCRERHGSCALELQH